MQLHAIPTRAPNLGRLTLLCAALLLLACTGDIADAPSSQLTMQAGFAGACALESGQCAQVPVCTNGSCACNAGLAACGATCANLGSDSANCGQCGVVCAAGSLCTAGQCACTGTGVSCNGACAELRSDPLHCGSCDRACAASEICDVGQCTAATSPSCIEACGGGRSCIAGTCTCPLGQSFCADACIDTQTAIANCGACGQACVTGQTCAAGSCSCAAGQLACGEACVDTQNSLTHCGGCDQPCGAGESCVAGACHGAVGADGCSGSARGVSIREIAVYQSIKIPVMQNQAEVAAANRIADVVTGRRTLVRVFVHPEPGFVARQLSARLTLSNSSGDDQYFAKQVISAESSDASTASTFMIFVPADKVAVDTRYAVELVECGADPGVGNMLAPRFPAADSAELGARETGVLKVKVVPVLTNSRLPDTSPAALEKYRAYLLAMYPVPDVEISVATQITTSYPVNWLSLLTQIRDKRASENPPGNVYYYGFVKPTDDTSVKAFCKGQCTAGIGYVGNPTDTGSRAAVGLAFQDEDSSLAMAHELGHNHGREHAPCAPAGASIDMVDIDFPYDGALVGVWGYDVRSDTLLDPSKTTDIMGYCARQWVSDYSYRGLIDHALAVDARFFTLGASALVARYRVLLVEDGMPRWSEPFAEPAEPFGTPELAEVLSADSSVRTTVTVYRTRIGDMNASTVLVPEGEAHWYALRVAGSPVIRF